MNKILPPTEERVCIYCGVTANDNPRGGFTYDHFIPRIEGGQDGDNLVLSCNPCNNIKGKAVFITIAQARMYIHQKLWSKNRQRWIDHRHIAFDGRRPNYE